MTGDAVLREVRPLARIPVVLLNVRSTLPTSSWTVHFVHGPRNTNAVTASPPLAAALASGGLRLRRYTIGGLEQDESLDRHVHFNYQKTPEFWRAFAAPMLLLFEPDTVMCPQPHVPLREFSQYAFVGAPWGAYASGLLPAWCNNLEHCVGNSGFSLWRRDVIAEVLSAPRTSSPCTLSAPCHPYSMRCAYACCGFVHCTLRCTERLSAAQCAVDANEPAHSAQAIGNETVSSLAPLVIDYLKARPSTFALALAFAFALVFALALALALTLSFDLALALASLQPQPQLQPNPKPSPKPHQAPPRRGKRAGPGMGSQKAMLLGRAGLARKGIKMSTIEASTRLHTTTAAPCAPAPLRYYTTAPLRHCATASLGQVVMNKWGVDIYMSTVLQSLRHHGRLPIPAVPPASFAAKFSVETVYKDDEHARVGTHKPYRFLNTTKLRRLMRNCPPVRKLLSATAKEDASADSRMAKGEQVMLASLAD